jgi:hypothetical protein
MKGRRLRRARLIAPRQGRHPDHPRSVLPPQAASKPSSFWGNDMCGGGGGGGGAQVSTLQPSQIPISRGGTAPDYDPKTGKQQQAASVVTAMDEGTKAASKTKTLLGQ